MVMIVMDPRRAKRPLMMSFKWTTKISFRRITCWLLFFFSSVLLCYRHTHFSLHSIYISVIYTCSWACARVGFYYICLCHLTKKVAIVITRLFFLCQIKQQSFYVYCRPECVWFFFFIHYKHSDLLYKRKSICHW